MQSESGASNAKISDSGYSNSCSNSQSQRSGSSKSRNSGSNSSRSSGYGGQASSGNNGQPQQPPNKRNKDKEHKKKKLKSASNNNSNNGSSSINICSSANSNNNNNNSSSNAAAGNIIGNNNGINLSSNAAIGGTIIEGHFEANTALGLAVVDGEKRDMASEGLELGEKGFSPLQVAPSPQVAITPPAAEESGLPPGEGKQQWDHCIDHSAEEVLQSPRHDHQDKSDSNKAACKPEDGFCCVISMYDGVILYTTAGLTNVLGFPKDMWLGRSFIDFVHPRDRDTFAAQITAEVATPLVDNHTNKAEVKSCVFVNLRKYRGLKTAGYGVTEKAVSYQPFRLTLTFRQVSVEAGDSKGMFLVVVAVPLHSAYKVSNENRKSTVFSTRHSAHGVLTHVDGDVATNFGFLPQEMLGQKIFDFYHHDDLPFLKNTYTTVLKRCQMAGSVFRSKPYRFACQNGGFATIETEWGCFVNPWTRKLEFIIGNHRVLQGPINPDVFESPYDKEIHLPDEMAKKVKALRDEIVFALSEELPRPIDSTKQQVSKRCKDLATFMENLMEEISKSNLKLDLPQENGDTISERDSVMLGEISPHHDYYDSKSSTETPPSYNQLNYNENIQRFFQSKPVTTVPDEVHGQLLQSTTDTDQEGKSSSAAQDGSSNQKCLSPVHNSGASGSGSTGSNNNLESATTSNTNTSNNSYKPPHLTEALLQKHNEEMEKIMMKKHREQRSNTKGERDRDLKKLHHKSNANAAVNNAVPDKIYAQQGCHGHGVKRSGSHSWEGDSHKVSKHQHAPVNGAPQQPEAMMKTSAIQVSAANVTMPFIENIYTPAQVGGANLWPPFSVAMTPVHTTQTCSANTIPGTGAAGMFPVYYFPAQTGQAAQEHTSVSLPSPFTGLYMPSMVYPPIFNASPVLYHSMYPPMIQPLSVPVSAAAASQPGQPQVVGAAAANGAPAKSGQFQRPASQATSVKAEPGSAVGSIASASVVNRALSECSRKRLGQQSPDSTPGEGEAAPSQAANGAQANNANQNPTLEESGNCSLEGDEESSYSSFYSSFLKTDTGSGSNNEDAGHVEVKQASNNGEERTWQKPKICPMRKPDPPWLEAVKVTPELIYRYQMAVKGIEDILDSDRNSLKETQQPVMVNDQLSQLYLEMELQGLSSKLSLEDGLTSSSSSGEEGGACGKLLLQQHQQLHSKKKRRSYSQLVMIYEENAPLPPPD